MSGISVVTRPHRPETDAAFATPKLHGVEQLRKFSPYLMIELLLPGGTLIAIVLWLINRQRAKTAHRSL